MDRPDPPSNAARDPAPPRRQALGRLAGLALGLGIGPRVGANPAARDSEWPRHRPVAGGVARLDLGPARTVPTARVGDRPVLVVGDAAGWTALVGIPLSQGLQPMAVQVDADGRMRTLTVDVEAVRYAEQRLKVAPGHVDLSPRDLARHERERAHQAGIMRRVSAPAPERLHMRAPTEGPRSSSFGLRRIFNGQPRQPHSGMDIAAPTGTPVVAPLAAEVADVGDYFFNGRTVWLDHGGGLMSMMCHLSQIDVVVGDRLAAGDRVAAVGATGRVTGPHLHWSVLLTGTMVDPALFL